MTYAAILVHAEPSDQAEPRIRLAADLANRFGAVLIGLGAEAYAPAIEVSTAEAAELQTRADEADIRAAFRRFELAASYVTAGREWRSAHDEPSAALVREARAADLIVIGAAGGLRGLAPDPGEVLMSSGRPILLAPPDQTGLDPCRVVVGWKDSREARRAVSDALPLLKQASRVRVIEVCPARAQAGAAARIEDVAASLRRHGVTAETKLIVGEDGDAAAALQDHCSGWEADLLVVGGFGRSRIREWIFGGVTRELLRGGSTPVLLSH